MTGAENERLATLEAKVDGLDKKFDKLEPKVDLLVARSEAWQGATAFARGLVPFFAVGVSVAAFVISLAKGI